MNGIELEAIEHHAHLDPAGIQRDHAPGDRYTIVDAYAAAALVAAGLAKVIDKPTKPTKAAR